MKKTTYTVTRFDIENNFYVECTPLDAVVEFYLCRTGYSLKMYMFGLYADQCPETMLEEIVENNVYDYIPDFLEEIED